MPRPPSDAIYLRNLRFEPPPVLPSTINRIRLQLSALGRIVPAGSKRREALDQLLDADPARLTEAQRATLDGLCWTYRASLPAGLAPARRPPGAG